MVGKLSAEGLNQQMDFITMAGDTSIVYQGRNVPYGHALAGQPGAPVRVTAAMTVGFAPDGARIFGVLNSVEPDKTCRVGKGGIQEFRIGATAPAVGAGVVAGTGNVVRAAAPAVAAEVTAASFNVVVDVDAVRGIAWVDLG